ncbi:hypothetical protein O7635_16695 [Asanoa sp. WMMD1127]|uniref:LppU/SCO3897 family protein n=1 Tax=Asanoa sp. WMMD1127 TaxID=3016107 RepID=UPI0024165357|nr:hypothetical protein [Asanoa sp. WMMD1127]MDG4823498.1 hypothetical protein [Asanoa sp. WMMD1127]
MSEQSTTPPPAPQQPQQPAGAPTPPPGGTLPTFTPPPPGAFPADGPQMADPTRPSNKRIALRKFLFSIVGLVLVLVVGFIWSVATGDPSIASTGDCLVGQESDKIKVVGCDDAAAEWRVVSEVEDVREEDFDAAGENFNGCVAQPSATAWFWSGTEGGKGDVLCLEPIKK